MPEPPVLKLQRLAQESETSILDLLLRAKAVAVKLDLDDARTWIEHEINGYPGGAALPAYRVIPSELRVKNRYHGWQPVIWGGNGSLPEHFATMEIRQAISEVEVIAAGGEGHPHSNLNQDEMDVLLGLNERFAHMPSARFYSHASFVGIVQGVRAKILDWALALEKKGVRGDGVEFNESEKRDASKVVLRVSDVSLTALFLSANPDPKSPLAVEKEQNRIVKVRNNSKYQSKVRVEALPDLDFPEFAKSLRLHAPTIVHFSGHGGSDGSLLMRDENGASFAMHPDGLAKLLMLQKSTIRLVVLNACYSSALADLLATEIDCVIGMTAPVSDNAAILFAQTLYAALFDGATIADAFATSLAAVQARYNGEKHVPELQMRTGVDASTVRFLE